MALHRDIEPAGPDREERIERLGGMVERRDLTRPWVVASGTLACPSCDLPIEPSGGVAVGSVLSCGWCEHTAPARFFFTLTDRPRPARVDVVATLR